MENKELQGVMFPHEKQTAKSPDMRGSVKIGGVDYYVSGWKRTSQYGNDYISLAFQRKDEVVKKADPAHKSK